MFRLLAAEPTEEIFEIWRQPERAITTREMKPREHEKFDNNAFDSLFEENVLLTRQGFYAKRPKRACTTAYAITICPHPLALMEHLGIQTFALPSHQVGASGRAGRPRSGSSRSHCLQTQPQADMAADRVGRSRAESRNGTKVVPETPASDASVATVTASVALPRNTLAILQARRRSGRESICWWLGTPGQASVSTFLFIDCEAVDGTVRPTTLGHKQLPSCLVAGCLSIKAWCILPKAESTTADMKPDVSLLQQHVLLRYIVGRAIWCWRSMFDVLQITDCVRGASSTVPSVRR
jgi:hypothetical protein